MSGFLDGAVGKYVRGLQRSKYGVLFGWGLLTLLLGFFGAIRLMALTRNHFEAPAGSPAAVAQSEMLHFFPGSNKNASDIIYVETPLGQHVLENSFLMNFTNTSRSYLRSNLKDDLFNCMTLSGYYSYVNDGLPVSAASLAFIGGHGSSSFLLVQYPKRFTMKYGKVLQKLQQVLSEIYIGPGKASYVGAMGVAFQAVEAADAATRSMTNMDLISVPLAFVVLAFSLRSVRLLILPLMTLFIGIVTSFGLMGIFAQMGLSISSATPPFMMSMLLAVSIDYALFLLTRFKEEVEIGSPVDVAIEHMLMYSGHTVCGSGFTLAFCFVALLFFPLQMMQSIGLGVIVSIFSAIIVNLTIVPSALLSCPNFFTNSESFGCSCCCSCRRHRHHRADAAHVGMLPAIVVRPFEAKAWFRWATFSTSLSATALVLLLLVSVGPAATIKFVGVHNSMDTLLMAPRGSISVETMQRFGQSFSEGYTSPYQLLLLPKHSETIYNEDFWSDASNLLKDIVAEVYTGRSERVGTLRSVMFSYNLEGKGERMFLPLGGAMFLDSRIKFPTEICKMLNQYEDDCTDFARTRSCPDLKPIASVAAYYVNVTSSEVLDACRLIQTMQNTTTTEALTAAYATLVPSEAMGSEAAVEWTKRCRGVLANTSKYPNVEAYLTGFTPEMLDAIDGINQRTPTVLLSTMVVCFVLISLIVVSLAFGLSSVILISWTIVAVFAVGILVYQDGIFGASAPFQLAGTGGLAWIVPPLSFTVILGLGLDYDIFLLGRVCEYRCKGYDDKQALAYGVAKTGPVITSAGVIMAVAFAGLMMSNVPMLNQVSLLLVVAVLIDTFFIRSLATPAVHAPLKALNWWPRKVPPVTTLLHESTERNTDSLHLVAPES